MATGVLGEGKLLLFSPKRPDYGLHPIDGIHVDMNHLKKGEVK